MDRNRISRVERRFRRIARRLRDADLRREASTDMDPDGLFAALVDKWDSRHFLGYYSREGLHTALTAYGLWDLLERRVPGGAELSLDLRDPTAHRLTIHHGGHRDDAHLLVELRARLVHRPLEVSFDAVLGDDPVDFLFVDWIRVQDPTRGFDADHLPFPGQIHPGIGAGIEVLTLIQMMSERLGLAGVINTPMHFHNAVLYHPRATFIDAEADGCFRALKRDLAHLPLLEASWAVHGACVSDATTGQPFRWTEREQLCAQRRRVRAHLRGKTFRTRRDRAAAERRFTVDDRRLAFVMDRIRDEVG